ncbi:MAG: RIP metalloprotease RseP [Lachnospiraceae bacterium]|nr:RIP metalloprotease RseP [Lachnospiraceae bacterium]
MRIILALLIFSVIVIVHELGHFLLAKRGSIRVNEFSIGMGPTLLSKQVGETCYAIKILPFGGSCVMEGEDGEATGTDSFTAKSVWTRISVVAAGPVFNFILAFVLSLILVGNIGYDDTVIDVTEGYPAAEAGIQDGDEIIRMGGSRTMVYREISLFNSMHQGETTEVVYERDGERYTVVLTPKQGEDGIYRYGFEKINTRTKGNVLEILKYSYAELRYWLKATVESLKMLVGGQVGLNDVSGPVGIVNAIGDTYEANKSDGWYYVALSMVMMSILLSVNLGVMNLLPIPALDGGRLVFLIIEVIRGKALPPEKEGMVHYAGFMLLMGLMVLILFNDMKNIFL